MRQLTPSEVGARAELAVASALARAGKDVYLPFFCAHGRVDLVFLDATGLYRVQCKTSRIVGEVIVFSTCSNTNDVRQDYRGDVDLFGVYSPELDRVFLVPVADAPSRACSPRLSSTRNGQAKGIRWADDYLLNGE